MKSLYFIFTDAKRNIRSNIFAFTIIILGMTVSLMTHLVLMGAISARIEEKKEYAMYNTISVANVSSENLKHSLGRVNNSDIVNAFLILKDEENSRLIIGWYGNTIRNWFPEGEGRFINSPDEAYVSSDIMFFDETQEQSVEVCGERYEVVGSTSLWSSNLMAGLNDFAVTNEYADYSSFVFVHISNMRTMNFENACLRVQLTSAEKYKDSYTAVIGEFLDNYENDILVPGNITKDIIRSELSFFLIIGAMCFLAYINILAVYWYTLDEQAVKYSIYILIGATRRKMLALLVSKFFAIYSMAYILAVLLSIPLKSLLRVLRLEMNLSGVLLFEIYEFGAISYLALSIWKIRKLIKPNTENLTIKV